MARPRSPTQSETRFLLVRGLDRLAGGRQDDRIHPLGVELWLQLGAQIGHQLVEGGLASLTPKLATDQATRLLQRLDLLRTNAAFASVGLIASVSFFPTRVPSLVK